MPERSRAWQIAVAMLQARQVGKEIAKLPVQVVLPPVEPKQIPHITPFEEPLQEKIIEPGEQDTVYLCKIPPRRIGYIQAVGNISFEDAYLIWMVDKIEIIKKPITWDIASINAPKQILPWLSVKDEVRWVGYNKSDKKCHFQVLCDGFHVWQEQVPTLLDMGLPLGEL